MGFYVFNGIVIKLTEIRDLAFLFHFSSFVAIAAVFWAG